ncbi:interleukin-17 receptor A-like [Elysia marginata]|uniref:Interleukin-17 receptor A-like n=1 Tax=Elysia marginata TaxID=1093978 RepID=A0AAV4J8K7_9GAST|nr:interleukin-17 receptor A-like [Elysia marginata]
MAVSTSLFSSIFASLLIGSALSEPKKCTLKVFNGDSEEQVEGVCLHQFDTEDCKPFVESFNRSALPEDFALTHHDDSVQRPESMEMTPQLNEYVNRTTHKRYLAPGVKIGWTSPVASLSRKNIRGYLLILFENKTICRLFKFNTTDRGILKRKLRFEYDVPYLKSDTFYKTLVYSMPPPENFEDSRRESTFVSMEITSGTVVQVDDASNPGEWIPSLSTKVLSNGTLQVGIGPSPPVFNLTEFEVQLVKYSDDENNAYRTAYHTQPPGLSSAEGIVTFSNLDTDQYRVVPGLSSAEGIVMFSNLDTDQYRVVVTALDPFKGKKDMCLCWKMEDNNQRHCMLNCGSVGTRYVHVTGVALLETTTTPRNADPTTSQDVRPGRVTEKPEEDFPIATDSILGISILAVLLCVLGLVVFVAGRKHRQKDNSGSVFDPLQPGSQVFHPPELKWKSVLIVSTEDNPAHTYMVEELAKFLKNCCLCHVYFSPWESIGPRYQEWFTWCRKAQDLANHILLVDSEGAENIMAAHKITGGRNGPFTDSSRSDVIFNLVLENFRVLPDTLEKTVLLHYREECGCSDYLSFPPKLRLPDDMPDLLRSIHNLTKEETKANMQCLPLSSNCYSTASNISGNLMSALTVLQQPPYSRMMSADTGVGSDEGATSNTDATSGGSSIGPDEGSLNGFHNDEEDVTGSPVSLSRDSDGSTVCTIASNNLNGGMTGVTLAGVTETSVEPCSFVNRQFSHLQSIGGPNQTLSLVPNNSESSFEPSLCDISNVTENPSTV